MGICVWDHVFSRRAILHVILLTYFCFSSSQVRLLSAHPFGIPFPIVTASALRVFSVVLHLLICCCRVNTIFVGLRLYWIILFCSRSRRDMASLQISIVDLIFDRSNKSGAGRQSSRGAVLFCCLPLKFVNCSLRSVAVSLLLLTKFLGTGVKAIFCLLGAVQFDFPVLRGGALVTLGVRVQYALLSCLVR